jgi:hypothetical protein
LGRINDAVASTSFVAAPRVGATDSTEESSAIGDVATGPVAPSGLKNQSFTSRKVDARTPTSQEDLSLSYEA